MGQVGSELWGKNRSTGTLLLIAAVRDKAARARRNEGDWDGDVGAAGVLSPAHPLPTGPRGRGTRGKLQVQSREVALLSPWVPLSVYREHVIGGATAWLLLSASVQSLPAACPVLFCTFLRGFLPLLLQHESVAVAFLVCSIVSVPNLVSVLNIFFLRSAVTLLFRGHAWRWGNST